MSFRTMALGALALGTVAVAAPTPASAYYAPCGGFLPFALACAVVDTAATVATAPFVVAGQILNPTPYYARPVYAAPAYGAPPAAYYAPYAAPAYSYYARPVAHYYAPVRPYYYAPRYGYGRPAYWRGY